MKPCPVEIVLFRTADGITNIGGYIPKSNSWLCEMFNEKYYDHDVTEWWQCTNQYH